jgi:hypothetical protein
LLEQTNNLVVGISVNTNDSMTVPRSSTIYLTNITINPALPVQFYRLVYPWNYRNRWPGKCNLSRLLFVAEFFIFACGQTPK